MPTLEWLCKDKVVNHHLDVPYRILERKYSFDAAGTRAEDVGSENMIVHGDNLEALKALLPRYEGRVKCVYIDPPYNTGNENWVYNDNVNAPRIRKWLGQVVGREGEDLSRHDKWLCMTYPRLRLLHKLLADDGAIFISIDDNELASLKLICDEIFGAACFVSNVSWQRTYSTRNDSKGIVNEAEHLLIYGKQPGWNPKKLPRTTSMDKRYSSPDDDPRPWKAGDASAPGAATHPGMVYAIQQPLTGELIYPPNGRCWTYGQEQMLAIMREWADYELRELDDYDKRASICGYTSGVPEKIGAIMLAQPTEETFRHTKKRYDDGVWPVLYFTTGGRGGIACKRYLDEMGGRIVTNLWPYAEVGHTDEASKTIKTIFDGRLAFDTPKPPRLIERILQIATGPNDIILDSFAGSGTTAHAVLNLNKADGGKRRFILVEMEDYADSITAERVKRVIQGYPTKEEKTLYDEEITPKNLASGAELLERAKAAAQEAKDSELYEKVSNPKIEGGRLQVIATLKAEVSAQGTGGDFSFYELGAPLLVDERLNPSAPLEKIREYIWFTETKTPFSPVADDNEYYLGTFNDAAYYFYYKSAETTTLDAAFLASVKSKNDITIVYADRCAVDAKKLKRLGVVFKKIPRDINGR